VHHPERELSGSICQKQGKGMSEIPTSVYHVRDIQNSGWPTGRESYGHGVLVVVSGWESQLQGEAGQTGKMRGKNGTEGCVMLPLMFQSTTTRRMIRKIIPDLKPVGEPDAEKLARPVRRGAVGKVPKGNSLAAYPTFPTFRVGRFSLCPTFTP